MGIKANFALSATVMCLILYSTTAQTIKNEIQILEASYGIEKKQIIEQVMQLSEKDALSFWAIYEDYEDKRQKLGEERLFLVHDYVTAYPTISDAMASKITSRCFKNDEALGKLRRSYYKRLSKALSPLKAAQFVQVEGFLENVVRIQLQTQLPFIQQLVPVSPTSVIERK